MPYGIYFKLSSFFISKNILYLILTLIIGVICGAAALPDYGPFVLMALLLGIVFFIISLRRPELWIVIYFLVIPITPVVYVNDRVPVHMGDLLFIIGILILIFCHTSKSHLVFNFFTLATFCYLFVGYLSLLFATMLHSFEIIVLGWLKWLRLLEAFFPYFYTILLARKLTKHNYFYNFSCINILFAGCLTSLYALYQFIFQIPIISPEYVWVSGKQLYRAGGIFQEANALANFLAMSIIIGLYMVFTQFPKYKLIKKIAILLNLLLMFSTLLLTFSRGGMLYLIIGLLLFIILSMKSLRSFIALFAKYTVIICLLVFCALGLFSFFLPEVNQALKDNLERTLFSDLNTASSGRISKWYSMINWLSSERSVYLFGIGYKMAQLIQQHHNMVIIADNGYLSALVEMGIGGLLALLLMIFSIITIIIKNKSIKNKDYEFKYFSITIISLWAGMAIQNFTVDAFTFWRSTPILFGLTGSYLVLAYHKK